MGEGLAALIKSKEGKALFLILGGMVLAFTIVNHYRTIQLRKLQIKELENKVGKND